MNTQLTPLRSVFALVFVSTGVRVQYAAPLTDDVAALEVRPSFTERTTGNRSSPDFLFPGKNKATVSVLTGFPYAGITEYTYGFTDRFAVGLWAGIITPQISGYGLRLRYVLSRPAPDFRIHVKAPIVYYPKSNGQAPWYLAWPNANAEWRRPNGTRLWTGLGLVGTMGGKYLPGVAAARAASSKPKKTSYGTGSAGGSYLHKTPSALGTGSIDDGSKAGLWNTVQIGMSKPLSRHIAFQFESALVMEGATVASSNWVGGWPAIVTTGISYSF